MGTRNLLVRAGFDATRMQRGTQQATRSLQNFGQQVNNTMGKVNKILAGAFALKAVSQFGKECVKLGSDLAEVQNVVNVTFGKMSENINSFSKTAITQFGLSETSAKKYTSTMGAMLKSMGLTSNQVLYMSKNMAGLSGDMASFYNLETDEAFAKIRAGISGETEPLKQLGINMSVANLEAYALSTGIRKSYKSMTQAEQALLRYNYLMKATADAQGDFSRTSDGWANQTRILKEQFNSLKATLGQAFITVLTPVVKMLNTLVLKLQTVAAYAKAFTESVFGKQQATGAGAIVKDMNSTTEGAESASDAIGGMGDSIEAAGKKAKGALAGFDEVNQLNFNEDTGSAGGEIGGDITSIPDLNLPDQAIEAAKFSDVLIKVQDEVKRVADLFKDGFKIGFGNANFDSIRSALESIKKSFNDLFTDTNVQSSFKNMMDSFIVNTGKVAGAMASIGITIATNLLGGFDKYLEQDMSFIKTKLISIFDISAEIFDAVGLWFTTLADVFSVFANEDGQQITANFMSMFSTAFLSLTELGLTVGRDVMTAMATGFSENRELIKEALENSLSIIKTTTGTARKFVADFFTSVKSTYDMYLGPALKSVIDGFISIGVTLLNTYNKYLAPVIQNIVTKFDKLYMDSIKPFVDSFMTLFGKLAEFLSVWFKKQIVEPFNWIVKVFGPGISAAFEIIYDTVDTVLRGIIGVIKGLMDALGGILTFLTGVFEGDWEKAWQGISDTFKGIWNGLVSIAKVPINMIIDSTNAMIRGLNKITIKAPDWINDLPGMEWLEGKSWGINIPEIPKLARGGITTGSTIANIGEAGREAVLPLENNTGWMDDLAVKVANAIMVGNSYSSQGNQPFIIEMDGYEVAKIIAPSINEACRRTGVILDAR